MAEHERATHIIRATQRVALTGPVSGTVGAIIGQFKSAVTKRINQLRDNPGCPVWQRNYYERVIRNDRELAYGIYVLNNSSPTVTGNTISGNQYGILILGDSSGTYQGNTFSSNQYGLNYSGITTLTATNNNWGDPSGPLDYSDDRATGGWYNPNGKGNKVSDNVNYYPWTGATITQTATPIGLSGAPRYASVNLTWHANSEPSLGGYKIYYGTAPGNYGAPIVVGKVTSYKLPGLTNDPPYYLAISSLNTVDAESARTAEITATPINKFAIDLTIAGTGDGSVLFTQGETACNTNCSTLFDPYTAVTLKATRDQYSLFKGWTGACTAPSGDCDLYMDDDKAVTATFDTDREHSVRIDLPEIKHYPSILGAYAAAAKIDIIKAWGTEFSEDFTFILNNAVTIKGGFNSEYSSNAGYTRLQGKITIQSGSLTVERLVIR
jgi:parallel beta-helix repeat protein